MKYTGFDSMVDEACRKMNQLEEEIAMEWFGVPYDELDEDEREEVTWEMQDRLGIGLESN